ncbi:beta-N-acetylglucosaminidase domain-containing protein [Phenylobacterium montanum]|uniref:Beta-N-acetylglucosaminidase domain-containing protein n=1 Tax=Phenylobacterium montanum TaxID=2823693 RepID=A0A975IUE6_9CAUL|nr:beta-N-acetylglucosaminidase domain-containing protein [Caulobacter sp. S6]QUD87449.1 beta-N-acetylglucosaminidase domain-containing protein [Caulobacter sp. S6]
MAVELGILEGYYGPPWSWSAREEQVAFLGERGYGFYLYAPKADKFLRRRWREHHPQPITEHLLSLARQCRRHKVRFGVGLSPFEVYRNFDADAQAALADKLAYLDAIGIDDLGILFDDMRGDAPELAVSQVRIVHWIAERTRATRIIVCPTYYTDDPALDRAFGERPPGYLAELGAALDPTVELFWTGEEVCSREYGIAHLERVAETFRRKPFLWDNYPVNDGPLMSPYLHLRAMTGRRAAIGPYLAAHGVNPALQPVLSRIPALSLIESYRLGDAYEYGKAFLTAATEVLGEELAGLVCRHISLLQDAGRDRLGPAALRLRERYGDFDHPGAKEIVAWLDGEYRITSEMIEAQ